GHNVLDLVETHTVEAVAELLWECEFRKYRSIIKPLATNLLGPAADTRSDLLRRALILCADHELNASSFTVRCIAATGASLPAAILGGLAALSGPRHGGATYQVEALWDEIKQGRRPSREPLPGFGHPLYPDGDPRAAAILAKVPVPWVADLPEKPNIDF